MARPRLLLRWKIALFIAALLVLAMAALAVGSVYIPWRDKLAAQRHVALDRVRPLSTIIVKLTAQGVSFRADVVRDLVVPVVEGPASSLGAGEMVFALIYDAHGTLLESASVANPEALERMSPALAALYLRQPRLAFDILAKGQRGVQSLSVKLKVDGTPEPVGRMLLGLSTVAIDAEARKGLLVDLLIFAATLVLALIGGVLIASRVSAPLASLAAAMGQMEQGEFGEDLQVPAHANDEIGDLSRSFNSMLFGLRERERLRGTLGRYVSGDVAERILSEENDLALQGEVRQVTALFLDVRGFTALSEKLSPPEVVALLNDYLRVMVESVQRRGGSINKFIGDAALCIWGAPNAVADAELSAVRAALEIQDGARALSASRAAQGLPVAGLGIGINSGQALAGNLGTAQRLEYTVIGDAVNVAERLQSQARAGEVVVSQTVYEQVHEQVEAVPREPVMLKGKSEPVPLWEVRRFLDNVSARRLAGSTEAA